MLGDNATADLTIIKDYINQGKDELFEMFGKTVQEKSASLTSVASQKSYDLPINFLRVNTVTYYDGSTTYPVNYITDRELWNALFITEHTSSIPTSYFIDLGFGPADATIELHPIPAESGQTITVQYTSMAKDMTKDDITDGTVTVTNGSTTVTGAGTSFESLSIGDYFTVTSDGDYYKILSVDSTTQITLTRSYEGMGQSGVSYRIIEIPPVPKGLQIALVYYATAHVAMINNTTKRYTDFINLYNTQVEKYKAEYSKRNVSSIISGNTGYSLQNPNYTPRVIT